MPHTPRSNAFTVIAAVLMSSATMFAQDPGAQSPGAPPPGPPPAPAPQTPGTTFTVTVVGTTPLPGVDQPADHVPAPVQTGSAQEIEDSGALALSDFVNRRMNGVYVNEVQSNPFQPDVNYRGFTASPLLGTPQGLSVYMDGVRLNQAFGEIVSWDLIPRIAISTTTLIPGSNPLFGLNALGGALSLETKDGRSSPGTTLLATYGADVRRSIEIEHGGRTSRGFHWYVAGNLFAEDGWREQSPSDVRQAFGKIGWQTPTRDLALSLGYANTSLTGNGLQDQLLLSREYSSIYTRPDTTGNRAALVNVTSRHQISSPMVLTWNGYYRDIRTETLNGDVNEESLDQPLYQPTADERAALAGAGYGDLPVTALDSSSTPFPSQRCIANALLNDEPAETCNGLINRTNTIQRNGGGSIQLTRRDAFGARENVVTVGAAFDRSTATFDQSTELGYLNPDRSVTGVGAFGDGGITGGSIAEEPYDTRVDLDGTITTWSLYATDTFPIGSRVHVTLSGRYNRTTVANRDQIEPGGGPGSLDGTHDFARFNPAAGATIRLTGDVGLYGGYSEGSRAPTSIELGCADPLEPCRLPNAMAGDPPLEQVVTRTVEGGIRDARGPLTWYAGFFHAVNNDDILFVTSERTGFGYFSNVGQTRRQGLELGLRRRFGRTTVGAGYTYLRATFESETTLNAAGNSSNDAAEAGLPGLEGEIVVEPGDRLPLVPRHMLKVFANVQATDRLDIEAGVVAVAGAYARGNENNLHEPDGTYYLGPGSTNSYAVVNIGGRYALTHWLQIVGQVDNLFGREYSTAAQLGPAAFNEDGSFASRPFPPTDGQLPIRHTTFVAPGSPARAWLGARLRF